MSNFLHDGKRFILKNRQIADEAPLQIYCAGLVFAPQTAIIRGEFKSELPSWICQFPQVNERWSAELQALEGHTHWVLSVAFSPNSRLLASASEDKTVRLWDTATGAQQQLLEGHTGRVQSAAFSPDSRLLASASPDKTVRLWDTATGALQETLSTERRVTELEFSQDGSHLSTDLGILNLQSRCGNYTSNSPETNPEIFLQRENWIALNGKPVLWLPPEARPSCSTVKANTIALGHMSGRISFIGFRS